MLHVERLMLPDSHPAKRCPRCKGENLPYHAYCKDCKALYAREWREIERIRHAETKERYQRYFDGIEDETLP